MQWLKTMDCQVEKKGKSNYIFSQKLYFKYKDADRSNFLKDEKCDIIKDISQKKSWMAILISENVNFSIRKITKDKEENYIMIYYSVYQKDFKFVSVYGLNHRISMLEVKPKVDISQSNNFSWRFQQSMFSNT